MLGEHHVGDGIMNEVVTKYILSLVSEHQSYNVTYLQYSCGFLDIARVGVWLACSIFEPTDLQR